MIILPSAKGFPRKPSTSYVTQNLILLLDASKTASYPGNGTVWYDLSGSGNNFNIVQGAWNSSGYMDFKGSYGIAKNSANINLAGDVTYVAVTRINNNIYDWRTLTRAYGGDHHVIVQSYYWNYNTPSAYRIGMYDNDTNQFLISDGLQSDLAGFASNNFDVMIWRFTNGDNPTWDMNVNGVPFGTITNQWARYNRGFGAIGGYHNENTTPSSAAQYWGDINYFAVYNRRLTDAEVAQSYQYLKPRYNSVTPLPPTKGIHTWLESDYGIVTQNAYGTVDASPVVGNYVRSWTSKVNSITFSQSQLGAMPIYSIDSNGVPYLSFNGSWLQAPSPRINYGRAEYTLYDWVATEKSSWFAGWYTTGSDANQDLFSVTTGGAGYPGIDLYARQSYSASNTCSMGAADSGPNGMGVTFGNNTSQLNTFQGMHVDLSPFAGGTNRGWLNNSSVYSAANTATTLSSEMNLQATPTIGRYGGNYNYFTGRVYYLIAYKGTQPDHTTMYNYLSAKYKYT
jgi:hypothetical protein